MVKYMDNRRQMGIALFIFTYCLWLTWLCLNKITMFSVVLDNSSTNFVRGFCIVVFIIDELILNQKYTWRTICGYTFIVLCLIVAIKSKNYYLIDTGVLIVVSRNVPFRLILKCTLLVQICLMILTLLSSSFGIIENRIYYRDDGSARFSFGYSYASYLAQAYMYMCISYVAIRKKEISLITLIMMLVGNIVIFVQTDTRNPFIITFTLVVIAGLLRFTNFDLVKLRFFRFATPFAIPLMASVSIYLGWFYNPFSTTYSTLNWMLSARISLGNKALHLYGIKPFGQYIQFISSGAAGGMVQGYNYVDSSYIQMLLVDGIIFSIVLYGLFYLVTKALVHDNDYFLIICVILIAVHSTIDPQLIYLWFSPFSLICGQCFMSRAERARVNAIKVTVGGNSE